MTDQWSWWIGTNRENFDEGGFTTLEAAIAAGRRAYRGDPFWICKAKQGPVLLSDWAGFDEVLERAEEEIQDNGELAECDQDSVIFEVTAEQEADLVRTLKAACDEWQIRHGAVFQPRTFTGFRHVERIERSGHE